jgi:hypothetical protein
MLPCMPPAPLIAVVTHMIFVVQVLQIPQHLQHHHGRTYRLPLWPALLHLLSITSIVLFICHRQLLAIVDSV